MKRATGQRGKNEATFIGFSIVTKQQAKPSAANIFGHAKPENRNQVRCRPASVPIPILCLIVTPWRSLGTASEWRRATLNAGIHSFGMGVSKLICWALLRPRLLLMTIAVNVLPCQGASVWVCVCQCVCVCPALTLHWYVAAPCWKFHLPFKWNYWPARNIVPAFPAPIPIPLREDSPGIRKYQIKSKLFLYS